MAILSVTSAMREGLWGWTGYYGGGTARAKGWGRSFHVGTGGGHSKFTGPMVNRLHGLQVRLAEEGRRAKAGKSNVKWSQAVCLIWCQSVQMTD